MIFSGLKGLCLCIKFTYLEFNIFQAGSIDVLHCYYAHGEDNESFQRRSYWLLEEWVSKHKCYLQSLFTIIPPPKKNTQDSLSLTQIRTPKKNIEGMGMGILRDAVMDLTQLVFHWHPWC